MVGVVWIGKKVPAEMAVLAAVLLLLAQPTPVPDGTSAAEHDTHPPIVIDGDDDVCRAEHTNDGRDTKTGIINCDQADGSDKKPFVIQGWSIDSPGADAPPGNDPPRCENSDHSAAVNICDVTYTIELRDLDIRSPYYPDQELRPAGVSIMGTANVQLKNVNIDAGGVGVYVHGGETTDTATKVTLQKVALRPLIDDPPWPLLTLNDPNDLPNRTVFPMLEIIDSEATVMDSHIDATLRSHAIRVDNRDAADQGARYLFRMESSKVENAHDVGLGVKRASLELHHNTFRNNSHATAFVHANNPNQDEPDFSFAQGGANVILTSLEYNITHNHFQIPHPQSIAISVETAAKGRIQENHFASDATYGIAISTLGTDCNSRIEYNDIEDLRVRNNDPSCTLFARWNWWGGAIGPSSDLSTAGQGQSSGKVDASPWLTRPLADLPEVTIDQPRPDSPVHQSVTLTGTATTTTPENPLTHVEATLQQGVWDQTRSTNTTARWTLPWDLSNTPRGPLTFWIRGCGEHECGVPERLDVRHVPIPPVPIAALTATPDVVQVGETLHLNASRSYSPEGETIVAYRFGGLGDEPRGWSEDPTLEVSFDTPGTHVVTADVMDENGFENQNAPQITVRVLSTQEAGEGLAYLPGPGSVTFLLVIIGLGFAHRRPRR